MARGLTMTMADVRKHQERHGFAPIHYATVEVGKYDPSSDPLHSKLKQRRGMNQTESEFSRILEAQKQRGEILDFKFEGISLTWGDGMRYKADFTVIVSKSPHAPSHMRLIEIKGGFKWSRDIVRYKGCKAEWKQHFEFQMWQKKNSQWQQLD